MKTVSELINKNKLPVSHSLAIATTAAALRADLNTSRFSSLKSFHEFETSTLP